MSFIAAAIIGTVGVVGSSLLASKGAKGAARTASRSADRAAELSFQLGQEQLEATAPLRQLALEQGQFRFGQEQRISPAFTSAALGAIPLLTEDINRQAGTGDVFQRRLEQQTRNIFSSLSPFGLADSSVSGRAVGEATAALTAADIENLQNQRFRLAGFAPQTPSFIGQGTAGLGLAGQSQLAGIGSQFQAGQFQAAGQLGSANALSQGLGQFGGGLLQFGLGGLFGGTGTPIASGISRAVPTSIFNMPRQ